MDKRNKSKVAAEEDNDDDDGEDEERDGEESWRKTNETNGPRGGWRKEAEAAV